MRSTEPEGQFNLGIFLAQIRMYNEYRKYKVLYFKKRTVKAVILYTATWQKAPLNSMGLASE